MYGACQPATLLTVLHLGYAVVNCIPAPLYPGSSQVLAGTYPGIYRILCPPPDAGPTLGLCGEIFPSKWADIYYPGMYAYAKTLTNGAQGYGAGTYPGT